MAYRIRELNATEAVVFYPLAWVIEADDGAAAWPAEPWLFVAGFRDLAALDRYVRITGKEIAG
jgi:hypothetical protein